MQASKRSCVPSKVGMRLVTVLTNAGMIVASSLSWTMNAL